MKLPQDFRDLLEEFARGGVEHVVIGGYAYGFHVEPRATKDLDILLQGGDENLARAAAALARYGAPASVVAAVAKLAPDEVAYIGQPPLRVDFLRTIDGVSTSEALARAVDTTWDGVAVRVIALDDLIVNKRAAGRPQDLVDAVKLERVRSRSGRPR
jgi:predicted nucleotidyltransferase